MSTPERQLLLEALNFYYEESDGITIGIPAELLMGLKAELEYVEPLPEPCAQLLDTGSASELFLVDEMHALHPNAEPLYTAEAARTLLFNLNALKAYQRWFRDLTTAIRKSVRKVPRDRLQWSSDPIIAQQACEIAVLRRRLAKRQGIDTVGPT